VASRAFVARVLRILPIAVLIALALQPGGVPGVGPVPPARAASGGCSPSSSTCYLFDVQLGSGPGVGTGFGTYRTIDGNGTFTGRIVCHYGNESQTGVCGWGYEQPQSGTAQTVFFSLLPDPGSQACQGSTCHGADEFQGTIQEIQGNYLDSSWSFELIDHVQVDVTIKGKGSGTVTSGPPGIDCPGDCDDLFPAGYPVKLTAKAAAGSVFAGWSGDCSGTERTCEFGPVELTSVTATFNKKATEPPVTEEPVTDEPTEPPEPTEEAPPEPTAVVASQTAGPVETITPTVGATIASSPLPAPTAVPSSTASTDIGNLPIVIGLAIVLVLLAGGAVFVARRPSG
jgi:hypothetical protein